MTYFSKNILNKKFIIFHRMKPTYVKNNKNTILYNYNIV